MSAQPHLRQLPRDYESRPFKAAEYAQKTEQRKDLPASGVCNMRSAKNNWDFWTSLPEALHQVTIVMSDRGIPAIYRHMHGFGSHTFSAERRWNNSFR